MNLADLHTDVAYGKSNGKIIWQPRISCWARDKWFMGEELPAPFTGLDLPDIYRKLGCSARLYEYWNKCFQMAEPQSIRRITRQLNDIDTERIIETPVGNITAIDRETPNSERGIRIKPEIVTQDDFKTAIWLTENTTWEWDADIYDKLSEEIGDLGAPTIFLPRVNIQDLYINKMGVEKALYAIYDWPELVEKYFEVLDECHFRLIDVINASPIDIINFGDNLHCGTLPPNLFEKYILPSYHKRCTKLHEAGKFVSSHWDGDTKSLLPYAKQTGLDGIEAITPKPQGDVTLEEIKDALGNEIFLLDGIPAILFDREYSVDMIKEYTHKLIEYFAPKLILGISDELSSTGDIERIYIVSEIVDNYNNSL